MDAETGLSGSADIVQVDKQLIQRITDRSATHSRLSVTKLKLVSGCLYNIDM